MGSSSVWGASAPGQEMDATLRLAQPPAMRDRESRYGAAKDVCRGLDARHVGRRAIGSPRPFAGHDNASGEYGAAACALHRIDLTLTSGREHIQ
jgi:hypothetical protein